MNISFVTIPVTSLDETIKFYQEVMDFQIVTRFGAGPQMEIVFMSDKNGNQLEFIQKSGESIQHDGSISIGFYVEDINATEAYLREHHVNIDQAPMTLPSGVKLMHARDLNGVALGFVQRPSK
ncbi:MAG: glyoxalase/Bleomycin resistance/Dioxygenase superfamily protein [Clostridia bacterium]|jgi:lactoylglutathione lyase|nr:glyoxalase/Bleomycin resistance/Dioxygenase superfamily protein [Clostridia bacterium]